jgi:osmotically-inducible protein OsmY
MFVLMGTAVLSVACSRSDKTTTEEPRSETTITAAIASAQAPARDEELIRRIEVAVAADPQLAIQARNMAIDVVDGYAVMSGSVDNQITKDAVERAVANVPGVKTTLNKLDVRSVNDAESDETIAYTIQRDLVTDPALKAEADKVTIDVNAGVVTLRGTVSSPYARATIERAITGRPGVVTVNNRLVVPSA